METLARPEDLRGIQLNFGEELVSVEEVLQLPLNPPMSVLEGMKELTAVGDVRLIGENGPAFACGRMRSNEAANAQTGEQGKFRAFFPRDAHVVVDILRHERFLPLLRTTIMASLEAMGVKDNYFKPRGLLDEQEYGKIPHEVRDPGDDYAQALSQSKDWGWPYYGAVDTTGKNILSITRYVEDSTEGLGFLDQTFIGRDGIKRSVVEGMQMNLDWAICRMALNPEGLVEMLAKNPKHHANQSWADSPEAFHHADGSWAEHHPENNWGVAALDVQAETYAALKAAAELYGRLGDEAEAAKLGAMASNLRAVVLKHFWVDDPTHYGGYFGRGTDRDEQGNLRVLAIRTSDMGALLDSGLLDDTDDRELNEELKFKREAVINNLMSKEMRCPSGIRTLSSDSVRYGHDRYHNGASWPHETYIAARGMERYKFKDNAVKLKKCIFNSYIATGLLSEHFSGDDDKSRLLVDQKVTVRDSTLPTESEYSIAREGEELQAWAAATVLALKIENDLLAAKRARKAGRSIIVNNVIAA